MVASALEQHQKIKLKLENETEKRTLPFWIHYKINVNTDPNVIDIAEEANDKIKLGLIKETDFDNDPYTIIPTIRRQNYFFQN